MLRELLHLEKSNLDEFFSHLDIEAAEKMLQALLACEGVVFFSGVGKSGFIAQKLAATLASLGKKSFFLPPGDTLHGDLGSVNNQDLVIFLSKSGESDELIQLMPFLRNKGVKILAFVCKSHSRLANLSHQYIILPMQKELCPFDLAPTTSTSVQLIFGNILLIAYMRSKNISVDDFAINHPAGSLGRGIIVKVSDLMLKGERLPLCQKDDLLVNVLVELSKKQCGCLLVVNDQMALEGIFTDGDLRRSLTNRGTDVLQLKMKDLMHTDPKIIEPFLLAKRALEMMEADCQHPITVLPVIENQKLVGLIKMHDILQMGI
ncbi:MAG: KpsF/GutQ family sugar-phosphate isomerase [Parachlamydiales bacterium]|nr:KpsF/GutQ family sugar-phosphate isomerase [Parachlamydiales bacterium]